MRVGIETSAMLGPLTGIGHYIHRLAEAILPLMRDGDELVAFDGWTRHPLDRAYLARIDERNRRSSRQRPANFATRFALRTYRTLQTLTPARQSMRQLKEIRFRNSEQRFDVFHAANCAPPAPIDKPVLPLIYDLSHIRYPASHPRERVQWLDRELPALLARASFVQTISEFSKTEIAALFSVSPDRIHVAYPGLTARFDPGPLATDAGHLAKQNVSPNNYFLVVATREPRKNFTTVAEAYANLPDAIRARAPLLWVGTAGWGQIALSPAVERVRTAGQIRTAGYVSDDALAALYRHTALFLMPSLYEGFGMPVAEALACGAPVAASRITVFEEVAGPLARYVEPLHVEGWTAAMREALDGRSEVDAAARARQIAPFSAARSAALTLDLYRRLAAA